MGQVFETLRRENDESRAISRVFSGLMDGLPSAGPHRRGRDRTDSQSWHLKAVLVNVIYPTYQAADVFGRRERWVSSTDRRSGAFENNLLIPLFPSYFFRRFA
jgi:hypothetical protein